MNGDTEMESVLIGRIVQFKIAFIKAKDSLIRFLLFSLYITPLEHITFIFRFIEFAIYKALYE